MNQFLLLCLLLVGLSLEDKPKGTTRSKLIKNAFKDVRLDPFGRSILGQTTPVGPLSHNFLQKHRLPGFPFEFPPIIPGSESKRYLIFPSDSAANYMASARRCHQMGGRLARLEGGAVEMEILGCAIGSPSFVAAWQGDDFGGPLKGACVVLYPGGVIVST